MDRHGAGGLDVIRDGSHHITISDLIDGLPITPRDLDETIVVRDLVEDSRLAGPGTMRW